MWFLLATSLLALSFQRLLASSCCSRPAASPSTTGFSLRLRSPPQLHWASSPCCAGARRHAALGPGLGAAAGRRRGGLFLHLLPSFAPGPDKAVVGPQSLPFTMYFNFDKALVPFLLLACLPSLFRDEARAPGPPWALAAARGGGAGAASAGCRASACGRNSTRRPGSGSSSWPTCSSFLAGKRCSAATCSNAWANGWALARPGAGLGAVRPGALRRRSAADVVRRPRRADLRVGPAVERPPVVATLFHFGLNLTHLLLFTYLLYRPA